MMPEVPQPQQVAAAVPAATCARWLAAIDAVAATLPADHPDTQPTSGGLRLTVLGDTLAAEIIHTVWQGAAGAAVRQRLQGPPQAVLTQCWVRRQFPAALRPAGQHPHFWHQDGAIGCRFDGSDEALLPLTIAWVPLMDCGVDAPSLEWVAPPHTQLLQPLPLMQAAQADGVQVRHAQLAAGDALVFGPALVHRTHVTPAMTRRRISVDLRFTDRPLPPRMRQERLLNLHA